VSSASAQAKTKTQNALRDAIRRTRARTRQVRKELADARAALAAVAATDRSVDDAMESRRIAFEDAHALLLSWQNEALLALIAAMEENVQGAKRETLGEALRNVSFASPVAATASPRPPPPPPASTAVTTPPSRKPKSPKSPTPRGAPWK
jgi:hypothetical protein